MDNLDISTEIDRILSSNIKDELLNQIPLELLQTPTIQKKYVRDEMSSAKSKQSFSRQNFQQDLYQKAEQIIKLKQTLQAELLNINQIVEDNQKLTEANLYLRQELKKIKAEWKSFQTNVTNDLNQQKQKFLRMEAQFSQALQLAHKKKQSKKLKMSIFSVFSIQKGNDPILQKEKHKNKKFQISPQQFVQNFYFGKTHKKSIESQTQSNAKKIENEIDELKDKVQRLNLENNRLKNQIQNLKKTEKIIENPIQKNAKQSRNENKTTVECYTSVFLKSVFSQPENTDQIIRSILFSQQKPFFKELKQAKYFGKMILGNKNGNGLQEYKNDFNYQGNFIRNQRHGMGKLFYKDKLVYMGEWKKGKFYGKGIIFYYMNLNIKKIEGNFKNGALEGHSTITLQSGHKVRAIFKNNKILENGMFLPSQKFSDKLFCCKSYQGKVKLISSEEVGYKLIFITNSGQTFNL